MTSTEKALQRRRMSRRIRETVALRRYTATLTANPDTAAEVAPIDEQDPRSP